ncbi:MAG: DUF3148 domain-containing protein [Thermosynechococcaceae cyanobacterium]
MSEVSHDGPNDALKAGDRVRLAVSPPYFKTAEPMPMLRPPNIVPLGEEGVILGREPGDVWRVRFERGAYLLDRKYLEPIQSEA